MIISIIAAMAENRVIGRENELPWDLPSEHRRFKEITMGHPVIMGRRTFESIGHPLTGRKNIIITTQQGFAPEGCTIVKDLQEAITACGNADEVFICGGESVFREAVPLADRIYLTIVDEEFDGDAYFPEIPDAFVEVERRKFEDILPYSMVRYERKTG
ncbi:MAG: dihydrofolate reductase [Nitrospirota bacterium]